MYCAAVSFFQKENKKKTVDAAKISNSLHDYFLRLCRVIVLSSMLCNFHSSLLVFLKSETFFQFVFVFF